MRRARTTANHIEINPASAHELVISEDCKIYNGKRFLLFDSFDTEPEDARILIFGSEENSNWFDLVGRLYVDGTFKVFYTLLTFIYF